MLNCWSKRMDHQRVETRIDFLQYLETDVSICIMSWLNDPADLVRASAVSRCWRHFVIANGLVKKLCLDMFPQLSDIVTLKTNEEVINVAEIGSENDMEQKILLKDHEVYAALLQALTKSKLSPMDCIKCAISASSTDNYPNESIVNTLIQKDRFSGRSSYWSSRGEINSDVPETLIYKLSADAWVVTEVHIQPFQAFFQSGKPIYSAKYVRIRVGYPKSPIEWDIKNLPLQEPADDNFAWTYTSPEFPMVQENCLHRIKLSKPVLSVGGYLQIQLSGRVQRQASDGLFYICVCKAQVLGRPLYPAFTIEVLQPSRKLFVEYCAENLKSLLQSTSWDEIPQLHRLKDDMFWERIYLIGNLLRNPNYWNANGHELYRALFLLNR